MTKIGVSGKHKIYIVRSDKIIPSSQSDFDGDYTSSFISWRAKKRGINELGTFEGTLRADPTKDSPFGGGDTKADDIKAGNFIFLMGGEKLICKYVINKPDYDQTDDVRITGIEAIGRVENKLLHRTNVSKKTFNQANIVDDVLWGSGGVLVDGASQNFAYKSGSAENDAYVSMTFDYDNRVKALKESCNKAKKEFLIHHGYNTSTVPYSAGDGIDIKATLSTGSSERTFYLSGTSRDCKVCSGTKETDSTANHIIMKGRDIRGKTIQTEVWDSTVRYAVDLTTTMDGWLDGDITAAEGITIPLKHGHGFEDGEQYYIKIDGEVIEVSVATGVMTVNANGRGERTTNMSYDTVPSPHKDGSEVITLELFSLATEQVKAFVGSLANATAIDTGVTLGTAFVWIGNEYMAYAGYGNVAGDYYLKVQRAWLLTGNQVESYAHSIGAKIIPWDMTISAPDSSPDTNSILANGLITKSYSDNSAIGKDALDKKARQLLDSKKGITKRIAISVSSPSTVWEDLCTTSVDSESCPIGQLVTLSDTDGINITAGDYRIVGYEYSGRRPNLIFYLNDTSVRGYSQGEYSFIDSYDHLSEDKRQESNRGTNSEVDTYSDNPDSNDTFSANNKEVTKVIVPMSAWTEQGLTPATYLTSDYHSSAANIGYVNGLVGGGGGGTVWTDNGALLFPASGDRHVVPHQDGLGYVGLGGRRWNTFNGVNLNIYGNTILGNDSLDIISINALFESHLRPLSSTYDLGDSAHRWGEIYGVKGNFSGLVDCNSSLHVAGAFTTMGHVTLGNAAADNITVNGTITSHLLPSHLTYDCGGASNRWAHIYGEVGNFSGTVNFTGTVNHSGTSNFTSVANFSDTLTVSGTSTLNGHVVLGSDSSDQVSFNAKAATNLDMNGNTITNCPSIESSVWSESGADLTPTNGIRNVMPYSIGDGDIGSTTVRWASIYGIGANFSGSVTLGDGALDSIIMNGTVTSSLNVTGAVSMTSTLGVTGTTTLNGHVVLGSDSSDQVSFNAKAATNLDMNGNTITNCPSIESSVWSDVGTNIKPTAGDRNVLPYSSTPMNMGSTGQRWGAFNGVNLDISGNTVLGDISTDTITFNGRANTDLLPIITTTYDLGSFNNKWQYGYIHDVKTNFVTAITGQLMISALQEGQDIYLNASEVTIGSDVDMTNHKITSCAGVSRSGTVLLQSIGAYDVNLNSGDGIWLMAQDDIYIQAENDILIKWNRSGTDYALDFNGQDIEPNLHNVIDLGSWNYHFDHFYACDSYTTTHSSNCDLAELQFVEKDVEEGHIVELIDGNSDEDKYLAEEAKRTLEKEKKNGKKCRYGGGRIIGLRGKWKKASVNSFRCPSIISSIPGVRLGSTRLREELYEQGKMKYIALSGSVPNVHIKGKFNTGDILVSAGKGFAKVDNKAPWNQAIGYAKQSGKDTICEVWVR